MPRLPFLNSSISYLIAWDLAALVSQRRRPLPFSWIPTPKYVKCPDAITELVAKLTGIMTEFNRMGSGIRGSARNNIVDLTPHMLFLAYCEWIYKSSTELEREICKCEELARKVGYHWNASPARELLREARRHQLSVEAVYREVIDGIFARSSQSIRDRVQSALVKVAAGMTVRSGRMAPYGGSRVTVDFAKQQFYIK